MSLLCMNDVIENKDTLAIDEPLEYAQLALDGEMQAWLEAIDSFDVW